MKKVKKVIAMTDYQKSHSRNFEQETLKPQKRRWRFRKSIIWFIAITAFVVGMLFSPLFTVKSIEVTGNEIITDEKIISLSEIVEGERLYAVNLKKSAQSVEYYPFIESARAERKLPNKIIIHIVERKPVGAIITPSGYIQVSKDARVLAVESSISNYNLPIISGVELLEIPSPGNVIKNDSLVQALEIIEKSDQILLNNIAELNVGRADYILACTNEGIEIRLGGVEDIQNRLIDLNALLQKVVAQKISVANIEYIDRRYQGAPVIKTK